MTKMRKRILGLGCAAVFALSQVPLVLQAAPLGVSADGATTVTLEAYGGNGAKTVELENGKLPDLPTPEREGYDFVGWFTAPVEVEFWGDKKGEDWTKLKDTYGNAGYTYLNGKSIAWYNEGEKPDPRYADNAGYNWENARWIEHSLGVQNATKGDLVKKGDMVSAGSTLYAMYDPKPITVYWYSNGWKGIDDTEYASTGRSTGFEYGGKFARLPLDEWVSWQGHEFKGWIDANGTKFEFDTNYDGEMLKNFFTPENYEPVLRLYAIYDDMTTVGGAVQSAKFKGLIGGGRTFDPNLGSHTFTATFDSKNKQLPANMGWELTSGSDHFDLTVSKDKTVATVTVKDEFKNHLPEAETVEVKFIFGEETYTTSATASHYYNNGKVVSGQWGACTAPYTMQYTCTACGQKKIVTTETKGHEIVSREVPATCTESAYTINVCVKCGETTRTPKEDSTPLGHDWKVTTEKSCGGTVTTTTCTRCGETQVETDPTAQHTWETSPTVDVAPTCTTEGQQSVHCKFCPAVKEQKTIPATGHSYSETKHEATCTEDGYTEKVCTKCGDTQREAGEEAKGHTKGEPVTLKATCIQDGAVNTYCTVCGALLESEKVSDPNAHAWSVNMTKTEDGFEITYRYCVLCGKEEEISKVEVAPAQQAEPAPQPDSEPVPEVQPEPTPEPVPEVQPEVQPEIEVQPEVSKTEPKAQEPEIQPEETAPEVQEPAVKPQAETPKTEQAPSVKLDKLPEAASEAPSTPAIVPERELAPKAPVAPEVSEPETKTTPVPQTEEGNNAAVSGGATVEILPSMESAGSDSGVWMWITLACVCGAALVCVPMAVVAVKRRK